MRTKHLYNVNFTVVDKSDHARRVSDYQVHAQSKFTLTKHLQHKYPGCYIRDISAAVVTPAYEQLALF